MIHISQFIENKCYWIAFIVSLLMLASTDPSTIVWYCLYAIISSTLVFSTLKLEPNYIINYIRENTKQGMLIILFSIIHSSILARSFYLVWIPSNKLASLAARFRLSSVQALRIIILFAYPCMVCSLFVFFSYLLKKYRYDNRRIVETGVVLFLASMIFQSAQGISCGVVNSLGLKNLFCGILIVGALIFFMNILIAEVKVSVLVGTLPFLLLSTINYYIYSFRGREICPADVFSVRTAINVAGDYRLFFSLAVMLGWLGWILLIAAFFSTRKEAENNKKPTRLYSGAICLLSILLVFVLAKDTPVKSWENAGSIVNGTVLNFLLQFRDSRVQIPENYSLDSIQQLERQYQTQEKIVHNQQPSIIVIMDESFTDFKVLGNDIQTEEPLLPFISSLKTNTISGYLYSSVYGGNTANSEFEFLTGNSMAFLPPGSVPYQQYLSENQFSILAFLHSAGYYCTATHPYEEHGWNRLNVYNCFGFDRVSFISDYPQNELVRKYVGDWEMFDFIISEYENRNENVGFFLFGITIQNHGGFTYANFESTVPLEYKEHYPEAEQYLSLANLSDRAVEHLVDYFSEVSDPVVICFFGDHQPKVEQSFLETVHGGAFDDLDSEMLKYKVPFFIWANYDIEEQTDVETSINYLSSHLLDVCGFELPAYNKFINDMEKYIPILTANGYYSTSNKRFLPISEATGEEKEVLNLYHIMEYNNMFDKDQESLFFK